MQNNFLIAINKPTGLTSSDVVVKVRHILSNYFNSKVKVGHMGTLDPGAAGLLLVGINKATRLFDLLLSKNKSYIGRLSFGKDTDTLDSYGKVINESKLPSKDDVLNKLNLFIGQIKQIPPMYSALKINGQKAYDLARKNIDIDLPERIVNINNIEVISFIENDGKLKSIDLSINCSSGTYIRTLFHDIANKCNVCGYMSYLIRNSLDNITLEQAATLDELKENPQKYFIDPLDIVKSFLPVYELNDKEYNFISTGRTIKTSLNENKIALTYKNELKFIGENIDNNIKSITNLE